MNEDTHGMTPKEYNQACKSGEFIHAKNIISEKFLDVIDLVITKARSFPDYPIEDLKKEALSWLEIEY